MRLPLPVADTSRGLAAFRVSCLASLLLWSAGTLAADIGTWQFRVFLDDKPIGEHRFEVRASGAGREVESRARFTVAALGIPLYRYVHDAREQWRGDCLSALSARTDDNGTHSEVSARTEGEHLVVEAPRAQRIEGCVMTFAYWNPRFLQQARLLNAQTGEYEPVRVTALPDRVMTVRGIAITASGFRIAGAASPIDVWYSPQREWIGLDATVRGGRHLHYRMT